MKKKKLSIKRIIGTIVAIVLAVVLVKACYIGFIAGRLYLAYSGKIDVTKPDTNKYDVRGVDVSRYQGNIDWDALHSQNISFAFIKATEGADYVDSNFNTNWQGSQQSGLYAGAYHYFSFGTEGLSQAENFISNVPKTDNVLPPVVDFELTSEDDSEKSYTQQQLAALLLKLKDYYGVTPILYTTPKAYIKYLSSGSEWKKYTLWMRNTYYEPYLDWTFWQFDDEGKLLGYDGDQQFIDLNVYNGDYKKFLKEFNLKEK